MIELFIKRPATTVMFVLLFVVLGVVSYFNLMIERTPKITLPLISIKAIYPGASPQEVESQILKKIEDAVAEISEIDRIHSTAYENFGHILVEFSLSADVNIKSIEVKDKVEAIINTLPSGAEKPEIAKFDPLVQPIMNMVLSSSKHDAVGLYEYSDKNLKNKLTTIQGVASVDLIGGKKRQINVKIDNLLMKKYYISINEVIGEISKRNINIPGGSIERTDSNTNVRFVGEFASIQDLANLIIISREGTKFKLSDIATVEDSFKKVETLAFHNGNEVVGLSIKKLSDGDAITISKKIQKELKKIEADLPEGMSLFIASDTTTSIIKETKNTIINIIFGIILTVIILYLFLGSFRTTLIASIVIPTSIISAFFLMDFSGFSINMMTLLAIASSLGTLIANALVVIENVSKYIDKGESSVQAAIKGTKEVAVAIFASAGTNLVVFTPIAFMGGIVGQFMQQFGLTVVYTTIFSIIASFSLTPMLCAVILSKKAKINIVTKMANRFNSWLIYEYKFVFNKTMNNRALTVIFAVLALVSLIYPLRYIGSEFFSSSDQDILISKITMPQGTSLEKTQKTVKHLESIFSKLPELKDYLSYTGVDGSQNATIIANLHPLASRSRNAKQIIDSLISVAATIPDAEISFSSEQGMASGGAEGDVVLNLYGIDYNKMLEISLEMKKIMEDSGYFRSVTSSYKNTKDEIQFIPNYAKLTQYGIKNVDIGPVLRNSINGNDTNIYKENGEEYKINIELDNIYKTSIDDIGDITLISKDGLMPISNLGEIQKAKALPTIFRKDKSRIITLSGYISKSTAGKVQEFLDTKFKKITMPDGYNYKYSGNAEHFEESAKEISKAFFIAVILTYMLIAAIMNSFLAPFVIVSSVITSFIGVFLFLFFAEYSINIGTMMSMIMVVGLTVNNAILLLDRAIQKLQEGLSMREALWQGSADKFRTIVMTSLAIIVGALPQLFDQFQTKAAMGAVIIGGMLGSIIFTFLTIPVIYSFTQKKRS